MHFPHVTITDEMLKSARQIATEVAMQRTKASPVDALAGVLGEMAFAQYLYDDWRRHELRTNKGKADFDTIEIKASAFPFSTRLHLLVREDYAERRKPLCTVQIVLDVKDAHAGDIPIGTHAILCGFATSEEIDAAPLKDFGSKLGGAGGYRCRYIPISKLHPMSDLKLM
jgi:hypothetical protein